MTGFGHFWQQGDAITRSVAALLLLMSVSAWVRDPLEGLAAAPRRARHARAVPAFWAAPSLDAGREQLAALRPRRRACSRCSTPPSPPRRGGTLEATRARSTRS